MKNCGEDYKNNGKCGSAGSETPSTTTTTECTKIPGEADCTCSNWVMGKGFCNVPVEIGGKLKGGQFFHKEVADGEVNGFYFGTSFICEFFYYAKYTVEYSECKFPGENGDQFNIRMKMKFCSDEGLALQHCQLGNKMTDIKALIKEECKKAGYELCKGFGGTGRHFDERLVKENIEPFGLI